MDENRSQIKGLFYWVGTDRSGLPGSDDGFFICSAGESYGPILDFFIGGKQRAARNIHDQENISFPLGILRDGDAVMGYPGYGAI